MTRAQLIEKSLKEQIKLKKADVYHFLKLIEDYCSLFEIQEKLKNEVKEKGVTIITYNSKGLEVEKINPAITEITKVNNQMIKILSVLGISPDENIIADGTGGGDDSGL